MTTKSIKPHLYKDVPKNDKDAFSSKYLRIEYVTKMAAHRGVYFFGSHAQSGYSLGNNQERYMDQNILAITFPGVYSLNRWVDLTPNKSYPRFHCLGPHKTEQAHFLIKDLYIVSIPQFKTDCSIYLVLLASTDGLVMYHCSVGTHIGHENYVYNNL